MSDRLVTFGLFFVAGLLRSFSNTSAKTVRRGGYSYQHRLKIGAGLCNVRGFVVVQVHRVKMDDGFVGRTDGVDIWVDERLGAIQLLCTLMHEIVHIEWGHSEHQPEHVEMAVRYETARRLLPLDRIVGVCKEDKPLETIARELSVTKRVLMDRAATLSDNEMLSAGCLACRKCPAINARLATRTLVAVA